MNVLFSKPDATALPHVVILGAGASRAALPNGDKNGKSIPLMDDLPDVLGDKWTKLVKRAGVPAGSFEAQFSWLRRCGGYEVALAEVEQLIAEFFRTLELPDHPTIYDYLVLGLRKQDIIATFNWDPFLMQALRRNRDTATMPDIRFLHGCVSYATCNEHDVLGIPTEECPFCAESLIQGKLIYPDDAKDYASDTMIHRDWMVVTEKLKQAIHFTIFGYSGPATDFNAKQLLLTEWKKNPFLMINHVEIIDIADSDELRRRWSEYIPHQHEIVISRFWESSIAKFPRRTIEWKIAASMYGIPTEAIGPYRTDDLPDLQAWYSKLAREEIRPSVNLGD